MLWDEKGWVLLPLSMILAHVHVDSLDEKTGVTRAGPESETDHAQFPVSLPSTLVYHWHNHSGHCSNLLLAYLFIHLAIGHDGFLLSWRVSLPTAAKVFLIQNPGQIPDLKEGQDYKPSLVFLTLVLPGSKEHIYGMSGAITPLQKPLFVLFIWKQKNPAAPLH